MTAAELITQALADTPEITFERDDDGDLGMWVGDTYATFAVTEEMLREGLKIRKGKKVFHKAVLA